MRRAGLQAAAGAGQASLLIRADHVYEEGVIRALVNHPGHLLVTETGKPVAAHLLSAGDESSARRILASDQPPAVADLPAGLTAIDDPAGLASTYNHALRKRAKPYVLPLTAETAKSIERRMFHGAYKGVTDFVTKYVWPLPAMAVTRWCADARKSRHSRSSMRRSSAAAGLTS